MQALVTYEESHVICLGKYSLRVHGFSTVVVAIQFNTATSPSSHKCYCKRSHTQLAGLGLVNYLFVVMYIQLLTIYALHPHFTSTCYNSSFLHIQASQSRNQYVQHVFLASLPFLMFKYLQLMKHIQVNIMFWKLRLHQCPILPFFVVLV